MIVARTQLGPLPTQCVRIEQATPGAWVQKPPTLLHCVTNQRRPKVTDVMSGYSRGWSCGSLPIYYSEYAKAAFIPDDLGSTPSPMHIAREAARKAVHTGAPDELYATLTGTYDDNDGTVTQVRDENGGGVNTPDPSCHYEMVQEGEDGGEYFDRPERSWSAGHFVLRKTVSYSWPASTWPTIAPAGSEVADYGVRYNIVTSSSTSTEAPEKPTPPKPRLYEGNSIGAVSGSYSDGYSERNDEEWKWKITADDLFSGGQWPIAGDGEYVGVVRWIERRTEEQDAEDVLIDETVRTEAFSVSPSAPWTGGKHTLSEDRDYTKIEAVEILAATVAPIAAFAEPDYSAFPYPGLDD